MGTPRLATLAAVLLACACKSEPPKPVPVIERAKFEDLYRAGKNIQGAMEVGLNRLKLSELLQALATEISIGKDQAKSDRETALVAKYEAALAAYRDGVMLMELAETYVQWGGEVPYHAIGKSNPEAAALVERYKLPTALRTRDDAQAMVITADGRSLIWASAGRMIDEASRLYYAEEVPAR